MLNIIKGTKPYRVVPPMVTKLSQVNQSTVTVAEQDLKSIKQVPGPFTLPGIGSGIGMMMDKEFNPLRLHRYWQHAVKKYGPIFRIDAFGNKNVFIVDPDDAKKVMEATSHNPARGGFMAVQMVRESMDKFFEGKHGILVEDGEEWWRVRRLTQGASMKPKIVKNYLDAHNEVAMEFCDIIKGFQDKYGEMPENFQEEIYKWALESVGLVTLDRRLGCLEPNLRDDSIPMTMIKNANIMFESINDLEIGGLRLYVYFETKAFKRLKSAQETFIRVSDENIKLAVEALENKPEGSELTLLESFLKTPGLSYIDLVTMILDMLFAGIDTTSHTVAFALYLLAKNPDKQEKIQKEIDEVFGGRTDFQKTDYAKLTYTKMVIKETLRLYPIGIGTIRVVDEDIAIKGYRIPKGFGVLSMGLISSRMEEYFPRPMEFIPERWGRDRPLGEIHPYAAIPFGIGTRMCIGRRIAEQEMVVFLTRVMQRFNVDYKYGEMDILTKLIFAPSEPLRFNFTERK